MKFTEENLGVNFNDPELGKGFLDTISKPKMTKGKIGKLDLIKIKTPVFQWTLSRR